MALERLFQGRNSMLCDFDSESVLYEKLSNTIHRGGRTKLEKLQKRIEDVDYYPIFETASLKKPQNNLLNILLLEITEQCNFKCSYCIYSDNYPNERSESSKSMSFEIAKKAVEDLIPFSSHDNTMIGFYGGEPLLNVHLIQQVIMFSKERFPDKKIGFSMTTNFFDANKYIEEIVDNEIYINLSLDGPKEVHDKFRKTKTGDSTYNKIISNLEKIENYSPGYINSHFSVLSTCNDPADILKVIDYFEQNEYFVSHITSPDPRGRINFEDKMINNSSENKLSTEFTKRILEGDDPKILRRLFDQDLKSIATRDKRIMPKELMLNGSCYPGRKRIFVDVDGHYHPCERFGHRLKIGSVKEGIKQEIINGTVESFASIRNELCGECWAQRICMPCLQHAKDPEGEISLVGLAQTCEEKKKRLLSGLGNYVRLLQSNSEKTEKYIMSINPLFERRLN